MLKKKRKKRAQSLMLWCRGIGFHLGINAHNFLYRMHHRISSKILHTNFSSFALNLVKSVRTIKNPTKKPWRWWFYWSYLHDGKSLSKRKKNSPQIWRWHLWTLSTIPRMWELSVVESTTLDNLHLRECTPFGEILCGKLFKLNLDKWAKAFSEDG